MYRAPQWAWFWKLNSSRGCTGACAAPATRLPIGRRRSTACSPRWWMPGAFEGSAATNGRRSNGWNANPGPPFTPMDTNRRAAPSRRCRPPGYRTRVRRSCAGSSPDAGERRRRLSAGTRPCADDRAGPMRLGRQRLRAEHIDRKPHPTPRAPPRRAPPPRIGRPKPGNAAHRSLWRARREAIGPQRYVHPRIVAGAPRAAPGPMGHPVTNADRRARGLVPPGAADSAKRSALAPAKGRRPSAQAPLPPNSSRISRTASHSALRRGTGRPLSHRTTHPRPNSTPTGVPCPPHIVWRANPHGPRPVPPRRRP